MLVWPIQDGIPEFFLISQSSPAGPWQVGCNKLGTFPHHQVRSSTSPCFCHTIKNCCLSLNFWLFNPCFCLDTWLLPLRSQICLFKYPDILFHLLLVCDTENSCIYFRTPGIQKDKWESLIRYSRDSTLNHVASMEKSRKSEIHLNRIFPPAFSVIQQNIIHFLLGSCRLQIIIWF